MTGCTCKGICEQYHLKKKADYAGGDVFCRQCAIAYTPMFLSNMGLDSRVCLCCHTILSNKPRHKSHNHQEIKQRYDYMKTFVELGLRSASSDRKENREQRLTEEQLKKLQKKRDNQHNWYMNHKEEYYRKHRERYGY